MPFQPFTPPPERHHQLVVHKPITSGAQLRRLEQDPAYTTGGVRVPISPWIKWPIIIALFVIFWWVSMPFRGLIMVLAVFWFFALGAHPVTHMGRAAHDLLDGDD